MTRPTFTSIKSKMRLGTPPGRGARRRRFAALGLVFAVLAMTTQVAAAEPVPVFGIDGEWLEAPAEVASGQALQARWTVDVSPDPETPTADAVENLTAELTLENGTFAELPEECLTEGVSSPSTISEDGTTLTCNLGTQSADATVAVTTPVTAAGEGGSAVTARGAVADQEVELPPVTIAAEEEPAAEEPATEEPAAEDAAAERPDPETPPTGDEEPVDPPPDAEDPTAPEDAGGGVVVQSANPTNTLIRFEQTFYAYVGAGENLDVLFTKEGGSGTEYPLTVRVQGPGGEAYSCPVIAPSDPIGAACSLPDLTSGTAGVWEIFFDLGAGTNLNPDYFSWNIDVQSGTTDISGRVYSERYVMDQVTANGFPDVTLWYQSQNGYLYEADYLGYNGIGSIFESNATGNALVGTCTSAYESVGYNGYDDDTARVYPTSTECGDRYKIFFELPDPSMPDTAVVAGGGTTWLTPPLELPDVTNLTFAQDAGTVTRSGDFTFDITGHQGTAYLQVDGNGDGDYTDPEDREIAVAVTADGTYTVAFDGLDGLGNPMTIFDPMEARILVDQAGEIHFVNTDVEVRASGLEVTKLNGPDSGSTTLYWNDTSLSTTDRDCLTSQPDGRAGVPSTGGVHEWDCSTAPSVGNTNTGLGGSWGDSRYIDDWTYHAVEEFEEILVAAVATDYGDAPETYATTLAAGGPYHGVVSGLSIGATTDIDLDGVPSVTANGDDITDTDDEDGIVGPIQMLIGESNTVTVNVVNTTINAATLAGWVDLDLSGTFDAGEMVSIPVTASGAYDLTFPAGSITGDTFSRFRLYEGTVTAITPGGAAVGGEVEDHPVSMYDHEIDKIPGSVVANADGTHTVTYTIESTRTGDGPAYDLVDTLMYGDGITITAAPTAVNTSPGTIPVVNGWDAGTTTLTVATGVAIADGVTHVYEVTVIVEVDTDTVTFESSDCTLGSGETGTGLLNSATVTVDEQEVEDTACPELAVPEHEKEVTSGPTPIGGGIYEVEYLITVSNTFAAAGEYDLDDALLFGDAVTIEGTPTVTNVTPGGITTNPSWDGQGDTVIVTDEPIAAGTASGPTTHTYTVTVQVSVDGEAITFENSDCSLTSGESGTGLMNSTTLTVDEQATEDDGCVAISEPVHEKTVTSEPVAIGGGVYEVEYLITVTNAGEADSTYDLDDALQYGDAVTIEGTPVVTNVTPGGIVTNPSWDGVGDTSIVVGEPIAAGTATTPTTHTYTVTVQFTVEGELTFENSDCSITGSEEGSGLVNTSTLTVNDEETEDDACPITPADISHTKELTSEAREVGDGRYEVEYTITVTNTSAGPGTYDLDDELRYGDGISIVDAEIVGPDGITVNSGWNGIADIVVVSGESIDGATSAGPATHTYVVTVTVDAPDGVTSEARDCAVDSGETGTGLTNHSTLTTEVAEEEAEVCGEVPPADADDTAVTDASDDADDSDGSDDSDDSDSLASTGTSVMAGLLAGLTLLVGGTLLVWERRRRLGPSTR